MTRTGNFRKVALVLATTASSLAFTSPASAQATDPYVGQMMQVGFNFCPRGWATASGQIIAIASNTALFSLLGTTYGGNGSSTFQLPDMRGRMAINQGNGPGLSPYVIGETTGTEATTLIVTEIPSHTHRSGIQTAVPQANSKTAAGNAFGISSNASYLGGSDPVGNLMNPGSVQFQPTGNNIPIPVRPPYQAVQWCIALQGVFPARN